MFEGFLESFLVNYFGKYLEGIDKKNLKIAVWRGEITITHVQLNKDIMKALDLPFKVKIGEVRNMFMKVKIFENWRKQ